MIRQTRKELRPLFLIWKDYSDDATLPKPPSPRATVDNGFLPRYDPFHRDVLVERKMGCVVFSFPEDRPWEES